ncbi:MurR/RpiR family transcriptional regulator [Zavarzinia sp.]|uniref:MurR/RpiR family transcriptional regulator n=1 Tax=Zavarzinia sp. TaxID=2027920 RepID=UPI003BB5F5BC
MTTEQGDSILARLAALSEDLTPREARAAGHLAATYPMAGLGSIGAFARGAGVSPQSVLRLVAKLGFPGYGAFQAALKHEVAMDLPSPLDRLTAMSKGARVHDFLDRFASRAAENVASTFAQLSRADFEKAARLLADPKRRLQLVGGRFTQTLAHLMALHLDIIRGNVLRPDAQALAWADRLADIGRQDVVIVYDIRRYQPDLVRFAAIAAEQGAEVILMTDSLTAPAAAHARLTLAAEIGMEGTWDSAAALLTIGEALIARVSELAQPRLKTRLARIEVLRARLRGDD